MLVLLAGALALAASLQSPPADRPSAERLARAGRTAEAMAIFIRIVDADPTDTDAQLWVARLELRLGRVADAEAGFRSVLEEHPSDIDARVGLASALLRKNRWREALGILAESEGAAVENADLFSVLGRAYRRAGDDRRAFEYFRRAKALSPSDPDIVDGYEAVARVYSHSLSFEGFSQGGAPGSDISSGWLAGDLRVAPRLHVRVGARLQRGPGYTDRTAGGGVVWRFARTTTAAVTAFGGPGNTALATRHISGEVTRYAGIFEIGANVRRLVFAGSDVIAASPLLAWDPGGRWRLDGRYTYSLTHLSPSGATSGDHSVMLRDTWRGWRRVWVNATAAHGIESFEQLTADRAGTLDATTVAGGLRIFLPSLTVLTATWEHQWRTNQTTIDRVTAAVAVSLP